MNSFPVQYSRLSTAALTQRIAECYGLETLSGQFLLHGVSDTYRFENQTEAYILKVYREAHRSRNEISGEVELLLTLKARGAKAAHPIADRAGAYIQEFNAPEGIRHGVLFSFAPGKSVLELSDNQVRSLGREMAFNHGITSQLELPFERNRYDVNTTLISPLRVIKPAFESLPDEYAQLAGLVEKVIQKLATFDTSRFSYGYCHYDYLPKNFHFDEHDRLTLFDFDFAGKGFLANDLASFSIHPFFNVLTGKTSREKADREMRGCLDAYRDVRPLLDEEIEAIPYLGVAFFVFYLGFQYENFDDWSNFFFGPRYLKERVATIQKYAEWYCQF